MVTSLQCSNCDGDLGLCVGGGGKVHEGMRGKTWDCGTRDLELWDECMSGKTWDCGMRDLGCGTVGREYTREDLGLWDEGLAAVGLWDEGIPEKPWDCVGGGGKVHKGVPRKTE